MLRRIPSFHGKATGLLVGAFGLLVLALALLAMGALNGGHGVKSVQAADGIDPSLRNMVGVFRRSQVAGDVLPGAVSALQQTGDAQPGENPVAGRRLDLASGARAYLWPKSSGVCYSSPGPAGCIPTALLAEHGVVLGAGGGSGEPFHVFGIARDGISAVSIKLEDGEEVSAPVRDNGLYVEVKRAPTTATWTNPDGISGKQSGLVPTASEIKQIVEQARAG